jgi:hypothetical protein
MLIAETYAELTGLITHAADQLCGGRVVVAHEGGYDPNYGPFCGKAVIETLHQGHQAPLTARVLDPFGHIVGGYGARPMRDDERAVVDQAAKLVDRITAPCGGAHNEHYADLAEAQQPVA